MATSSPRRGVSSAPSIALQAVNVGLSARRHCVFSSTLFWIELAEGRPNRAFVLAVLVLSHAANLFFVAQRHDGGRPTGTYKLASCRRFLLLAMTLWALARTCPACADLNLAESPVEDF
jgi:hypothetical protein